MFTSWHPEAVARVESKRSIQWAGARGALPVRGKGRAHPDVEQSRRTFFQPDRADSRRCERRFVCLPAICLPVRTSSNTRNKQRSCATPIDRAMPMPSRRVAQHVRAVDASDAGTTKALALADAQFVVAREHGFDSWPKFAKHIETLTIAREVEALADPVAAFFEAAGPPRAGHSSGTLERAEAIRARHPEVARSSIYAAAMIADEAAVRDFLARDAALAAAKGGPFGWDALTYLCFSRYLRLDALRSDAFVRTARVLLDAGANANTGWYETIDTPPATDHRERDLRSRRRGAARRRDAAAPRARCRSERRRDAVSRSRRRGTTTCFESCSRAAG